jgi:hypothetical protein
MQARRTPEANALRLFVEAASRAGLATSFGQGAANRIAMTNETYFQYGDLRVELHDSVVVVEAEGAGGVTNLVKYWPLIENGRIQKKLLLFHLFCTQTPTDYASHRELWNFL